MKRQEYRAFSVVSNSLPKSKHHQSMLDLGINSDSSISRTNNDRTDSALDYSAFDVD